MPLRLTIFFVTLILSGCVPVGKHKELEMAKFKTEQDVKLQKEADPDKLAEKYKECMGQIGTLYREKVASDVAMEYMRKKGWKPATVEEKVYLKENENDYTGEEYVVISGEGLSGKPALYEASPMSSLLWVKPGPILAKEIFLGLEIIDSMGSEVELRRK